jgi:fermentation-respiration switch protein FrsA (DUF1100 family)
METLRWSKTNKGQAIFLGALAIVAAHLVIASLFSLEASWPERFAWAVAAVAVAVAAGAAYPRLSRPWRGVAALAFGLPALAVGIGIHVVHVAQSGVETTDVTGVPMACAGLALTALGTTILVRLIHTWWRRLLLAPGGLAFVIWVMFPVVLAIAVTNVPRAEVCCDDTPADHGFAYEDVTFETAQGLTISGWYIPSENGAAVITVHGSGSTRVKTMDESLVLARNGYGVLMIDVEGFGESEGKANGFGWAGARDVHAAVDYLRDERGIDPERIGGLGLSMGGEVMIQAAGESTALKAIVAEGATARTADDFDEMPGADGLLPASIHVTVGLTLRLLTGESTPPPLKEMMAQIGPRPALLIAADYAEEPAMTRLYQEVGGPSVDVWQIPEADHVGAYDNHPEEYEERVIAFFDEALLDTPAAVTR